MLSDIRDDIQNVSSLRYVVLHSLYTLLNCKALRVRTLCLLCPGLVCSFIFSCTFTFLTGLDFLDLIFICFLVTRFVTSHLSSIHISLFAQMFMLSTCFLTIFMLTSLCSLRIRQLRVLPEIGEVR